MKKIETFTSTIRMVGGTRLVVMSEEYTGSLDLRNNQVPEEFHVDNLKVFMTVETPESPDNNGEPIYTFVKRD